MLAGLLSLPTAGCMSTVSRLGFRGTTAYAIQPGIINLIDDIEYRPHAAEWTALVLDGPLCVVVDTVLMPIDIIMWLATSEPDDESQPAA